MFNGAGPWDKSGGIKADASNSEAKPHFIFYGRRGTTDDTPVGEDPSKGAFAYAVLARAASVYLVNEGFTPYAEVLFTYDIGGQGIAETNVVTKNTSEHSQDVLESVIKERFPSNFGEVVDAFGLNDPQIYRQLALTGDYFHNRALPWNNPEYVKNVVESSSAYAKRA